MIDLTVHPDVLERTVARARDQGITIPTFAQMVEPSATPAVIVERLRQVGLWDLDPLNLWRITWHNEPVPHGGGFGPVNYLEFPPELTGVEARIVGLVGKWFPTGSHKVGAAFGCLVPRLVTGQFDPTAQKAVWPSTGNYCRGGAFDAHILACDSVAILPEGMSQERFDWLARVAGEVIPTPGSESNVKEIFDKCWELRRSGEDVVIFNQFDEFGNYLWHYAVTGPAVAEVLAAVANPEDRFAAFVSSTGSAGTIACGDWLKQHHPRLTVAASEALQCPTLLQAGFGAHRIEGIGDKHVPWIHNVRNTDMVMAVDDAGPMALLRLFNEEQGAEYLQSAGVAGEVVEALPLLGISSIANLISSVKLARYFEFGSTDVVITVLTDSAEMYESRIAELRSEQGELDAVGAAVAHERWLLGAVVDNMAELGYRERKRIHNLKYFTWVEQQAKDVAELERQWEDPGYWEDVQGLAPRIDTLIEEFNDAVGLLAEWS
jgi:cysteine synthase A